MTDCYCSCDSTSEVSGVKVGGSVIVTDNMQAYSNMSCWPLNESALPFVDRTFGADSVGGTLPEYASGPACNWARQFTGRDYIELEQDYYKEYFGFTVSMWVKIQSTYEQRAWYSRGNPFSVYLGHSAINTIVSKIAYYRTTEVVSCFGQTQLDIDKWYHVATVYRPGDSLTVHLNGVLDGSVALTDENYVVSTGPQYIGRANDAGSPTGGIADVRFHRVMRDEDWLAMEHDMICNSHNYYTVSADVEEQGYI